MAFRWAALTAALLVVPMADLTAANSVFCWVASMAVRTAGYWVYMMVAKTDAQMVAKTAAQMVAKTDAQMVAKTAAQMVG